MAATAQGKRASEMDADHQRFLDAQKTTMRCALEGCKWKYVGGAAEGRLQAEKHRQAEHPERARGGALQKAFEARKRRRSPWKPAEILDAFRRFHAEYDRGAVPNDIPLCPYLPSMNTVVKAFGSWSAARDRSQADASAPVAAPEPQATGDPPKPAAAPKRRAGGDRATDPEPPATRVRRLLHELADAVADVLEVR